jgi:hypothetical protein
MSLHVASLPESPAPPHVNDGDLLRFEDAELDASERGRVATHLAACAQCAERRDALLAIAAWLRVAYRDTVMPPALATPPWQSALRARRVRAIRMPPRPAAVGRRALGTAMRAAAALTLLAVAAAAATPVREWIGARFGRSIVSSPVAPPAPTRPRSEPALGPLDSHTAAVSFVPTSEVLTIDLSAARGDSIEVQATMSDAVHVRARASGGEPTLTVMPDRLKLVSASSSATVYSVGVPPDVGLVEIRIGGRVLVRLTRAVLVAHGGWHRLLP